MRLILVTLTLGLLAPLLLDSGSLMLTGQHPPPWPANVIQALLLLNLFWVRLAKFPWLVSRGRFDAALAFALQQARAKPSLPLKRQAWLYNVANISFWLQRYDDSQKALDELAAEVVAPPLSHLCSRIRALNLVFSGAPLTQAEALVAAATKQASDAAAWYAAGFVADRLGKLAEGDAAFGRAEAVVGRRLWFGNKVAFYRSYGMREAAEGFYRGHHAMVRGDQVAAAAAFRRSVAVPFANVFSAHSAAYLADL